MRRALTLGLTQTFQSQGSVSWMAFHAHRYVTEITLNASYLMVSVKGLISVIREDFLSQLLTNSL